jgi:hypothetical protein
MQSRKNHTKKKIVCSPVTWGQYEASPRKLILSDEIQLVYPTTISIAMKFLTRIAEGSLYLLALLQLHIKKKLL